MRFKILVVALLSLFVLGGCIESPSFEGDLVFGVIEKFDRDKLDGPSLFIAGGTEKVYPCANYLINSRLTIENKKIIVILGDVQNSNMCLTAEGPAILNEELKINSGVYSLEFHAKNAVDKYELIVDDEKVEIKVIENSFSKIQFDLEERWDSRGDLVKTDKFEENTLYRTPKGLIVPNCKNDSTHKGDGDFCQGFFSRVSEIADEVEDPFSIYKRDFFGCSEKDYYEYSECKFYILTGSIEELDVLMAEYTQQSPTMEEYSSGNYKEQDDYYIRTDTWLGHTLCC